MINYNNNINQTNDQKHKIPTVRSLERVTGYLDSMLVTKYNWSLLLLSLITWSVIAYFGYYNTNFDIMSSAANYIIATSLISILIGFVQRIERSRIIVLMKIAITTLFVAFLGLISVKSIEPMFNNLGCFLLLPLGIFGFFLLLKNLWLLSDSNYKRHRG